MRSEKKIRARIDLLIKKKKDFENLTVTLKENPMARLMLSVSLEMARLAQVDALKWVLGEEKDE